MKTFLFSAFLALFAAPVAAIAATCDANGLGPAISAMGMKTNDTRQAQGRPQLRLDAKLNRAAQRHACDLARRQTASHRSSTGSRPMARIRQAGFRACFSAENVAQGTKSPDRTIRAWQGSTGHARNQLDPRADSMGFGVARGGDGRLYWVAVYAADCATRTATRSPTTGLRPFSW